jgi:integrase
MASIRERDGKYQVRIVRKGYPPLSRTFTTRTDAARWARATEVEIERGAIVSGAKCPTLAEAIERYMAECTPRKKSARSERYLLQSWARSSLAPCLLIRLRPSQIAQWRDRRLAQGASVQTVRNGLTALSTVFEQAIREWGVDYAINPVRRIKRPSPPKARTRRVSDTEVLAIKAVTGSPHLSDLIDLAVETAMRLGELVALRVGQIDLAARTVALPDSKNGHGRTVPLSRTAIQILERRQDEAGPDPKARLFPVTSHAVTVAFRRAVQRAKACRSANGQDHGSRHHLDDLRFHDLRREATSRLFERGLDVMAVSSVTGHRVLEMVRRYTALKATDIAIKLDK